MRIMILRVTIRTSMRLRSRPRIRKDLVVEHVGPAVVEVGEGGVEVVNVGVDLEKGEDAHGHAQTS